MPPLAPPPRAPDYFAEPERIQETARSKQVGRLRAYYDGTQYDGRPDFFTGTNGNGEVVPLRERKPCIIYPLPRAACNQATRFTFGEGRFPQIAVGESDDDSDDGPLALDEEEAKVLTRFLGDIIESSRLKSAMRRLLRIGLSQRSAVAVLSVRRGKFCIDMPRPQDCAVEFVDGDPEAEVARLVWCYPFQKEILREDRVDLVPHLFRRDFTETDVVFYEDAKIEAGKPPVWVRDETRSRSHGLGFCPVRWIRNLPAEDCTDIDGISIFEGLEDELDALNFALSQRHRGIVYFGTPQAWETGVSEDERPGEVARIERPAKTTTNPAAKKDPFASGGGGGRKKAPDQVWSYRSPDAEVGVMETTGAAFDAASKHVADIRSRILETMDVVLMDSGQIAGKGEMSAKALALLFSPLLALVDELRDCWWSTGLAPILGMILRITLALGGQGLLVPNANQVAGICRRFLRDFADPNNPALGSVKVWTNPKILPSWGAYFSPTNDEIGTLVEATAAAKAGGLIGAETAKRNVAPYFGETETDDDEADPQRPPSAGGGDKDTMDPLHMDVCDEARRLLLPSGMLATLRVERLGSLGETTVWSVNGNAIRDLDLDFELGANASRYVYVPPGDIWVDQGLTARPADLAAVAFHHAIEGAIMAEGEISHDCAHHAAEAMEKILRTATRVPAGGAALTPAAALATAAIWLPGLLASAQGLAAAHHATAMPTPGDAAPSSERGEVPGERDPDSQRSPAGGPSKGQAQAKKPPRR